MFKAIKRIGKDKTVFDVAIRPINVRIYSNQPFNFKVRVQRGKNDPEETKQVKVERSMKQSDIKIVTFTDVFNVPCTYFVKNGIPEDKMCTFSVVKLFPGGNEVVIAVKEVNLSRCFGQDFQEVTVEMEPTKQAQGSNVKSFTFQAEISIKDPKDRAVFEQCVQWRQLTEDAEEAQRMIIQ